MNSAIFEGQVSHRRLTPRPHAFRYRMFMMFLDLSELDAVFKGRWFWSSRRTALARFRRSDHLGDADVPLDTSVRRVVESDLGFHPNGPIRLLTHLSYFGYCFNPVSFYYCFDEQGETLEAIVAEVNNTPWGERHCYVLDQRRAEGGAISHQPDKEMHVSPFMPMDIGYRWRFTRPAQRLAVHMANHRDQQKVFDATLVLKRTEISAWSLARVLLVYPMMTFKVIVAIHWQALRLWLKKTPVYDHPAKASGHGFKENNA